MKILKKTAIIALMLYGQSILALSARALADRKDRVMQLQKKKVLTPDERAERTKIMKELRTDKNAAEIVNTLAADNQKQDLAIAQSQAANVAQAAATAQSTVTKLAVPEETKAKLNAVLTELRANADSLKTKAAASSSTPSANNIARAQQATADLREFLAGFNGLLDDLDKKKQWDARVALEPSASAINAAVDSIADIGKEFMAQGSGGSEAGYLQAQAAVERLEADKEDSGIAAALPVVGSKSGTAQADIPALGGLAESKKSESRTEERNARIENWVNLAKSLLAEIKKAEQNIESAPVVNAYIERFEKMNTDANITSADQLFGSWDRLTGSTPLMRESKQLYIDIDTALKAADKAATQALRERSKIIHRSDIPEPSMPSTEGLAAGITEPLPKQSGIIQRYQ